LLLEHIKFCLGVFLKKLVSSFGVTVLGFAGVGLFAGSASWNNEGSGDWGKEDNWLQTSGVNTIFPNGKDDVASFPAFNPMNPAVITVSGTYDIGTLRFDGDYKYTLSSGTLNVYRSICTNGELDINSNLVLENSVDIMANGNCMIAGNISGKCGLVKQGAGDLTLSGKNSYQGPTLVQSGLFQAGGENVFSPVSDVEIANTTGVVFSLNNFNNQIGSLGGGGKLGGNLLLGSATLTVGNDCDTQYDGEIFGKGGLIKVGSGSLTLSGLNTYSGVTEIRAGALQTGCEGAIPQKSALILANHVGASLDLCGYNQTIPTVKGGGVLGGDINLGKATLTLGDKKDMTFSGAIRGAGGIIKQGVGTLTLDRMNTYTGPTLIKEGTLNVTGILHSTVTVNEKTTLKGSGIIVGNVLNFGSVKLGDGVGSLTITGNHIQKSGSSFHIKLDGAKPDKLIILGALTIEDNVQLNISLPANAPSGTLFEIVSAGCGINGTFIKINPPKQCIVTMTSHTIVIEKK
jgi:autotransporter-associated beta strand protein